MKIFSWKWSLRAAIAAIIALGGLRGELLLAVEPFHDPALNLRVVESGVYAEIGCSETPRIIEGAFGYQGYVNDHLAFHSGLAFLASEPLDAFFGGLRAGLRVGIGRGPTPFAGAGVFVGYAEKSDDNRKESNGAGRVSMDGERIIIGDTIATVYPEAGLSLPFGHGHRITVSVRHHFVSKGSEFDFWTFHLGVSYQIR